MSRAYVIAAERIGKKVLAQKLGLGSKYHDALRKYGEVSTFPYVFTDFWPMIITIETLLMHV